MKTRGSIAVDRARPIGLWALSGVVLSLGCESLDTSGEVIHPIVDSLTTPPGEATVVLSRGGGRSGEGSTGPVATIRERFERREEVATIGDMEGTEEETFGLLWDAAITGAGEVLILDRIRTDVRVFSVTGDYLYTLGGQGEGPGELQVPEALVLEPGGDLLVVDQAQLIHRFARRGDRLEYRDRTRFEGEPRDACRAADDLVIHGLRSGAEQNVLHRTAADGRPEFGFAVPYRYAPSLAYEMLSRGQVACGVDAGGWVVIAYRLRNAIEAYDIVDGELVWNARIDGLRPTEVRERRGGREVGTGIFGDEPALHFLERVAGGNGVPVFVQYSYSLREDILNRTGRHTVETYVLDPGTGEGEYWGDSIPPLLAVSDEYAVFYRNDPYPQVRVARIPR